MQITKKTVWVIMNKDRTIIAKGTLRNRELMRVNEKDIKRFLTYSTKGRAEGAFKSDGFYGQHLLEGWECGKKLNEFLEAVECEMTLEIK